ncbi:YkgJ family cysteine cluster protein [Helicobacter sp. MIT 03-1614]|uniref:YkgJ family cysteine cluster protein n=1 Tax=Helicobacter sp. MIT 03-1614 TaxID=1548147 RepID=UPI000512B857|nr:YkgJ family cysteine cluster protein [Helicobacter sp. MIT 03-1614]TLD90375.1 YkgJ family cysteine cluster protein [Helicobacter sp. MIT 03-1614]
MNINKDYPFTFESHACKSCGGKCCTGKSGYVFVSIDEMLDIASSLNLDFESFTRSYVRKVGYRFSFIEKADNGALSCIFFNTYTKECNIYKHRPKQCRDFPFWEAHKSLDENALAMLMHECQGIRTKKE